MPLIVFELFCTMVLFKMVFHRPKWNYTHVCTVKTYEILNVKNFLLPTIFVLRSDVANTLCNPVFYYDEIQEGWLASRIINQKLLLEKILIGPHSRKGYFWSNFFRFCRGRL
jgi:hypothetical protein